jgi:glycosyltransferase involved in cell wall biosynthesis
MVFSLQDPRRAPLPSPDASLGYVTLRSANPAGMLPGVLEDFAPEAVVVGGYHPKTAPLTRRMLEGAAHLPTVLHLHDYATAPLVAERDLAIDAVVAVSDFIAQEAAAHGVQATCIPPMVERRRYRVPTSRRVALFINPVPQKGVGTALALARARPDIPFAFTRCWYIKPRTLSALTAEARRLGNVEVRPAAADPTRIYGDARVLLVPSPYPEAWARVAPEAHMSGIPVIASRIGGLPEAVGDGGILVDPEASIDVWAATLSKLWDDQASYEKQASLADGQGRRGDLEPGRVGDRFESLISEVVERSSARCTTARSRRSS